MQRSSEVLLKVSEKIKCRGFLKRTTYVLLNCTVPASAYVTHVTYKAKDAREGAYKDEGKGIEKSHLIAINYVANKIKNTGQSTSVCLLTHSSNQHVSFPL